MDWYLLYIIASILIIPSFIYGAISQNLVYSTFESFSKQKSNSGITAAELANQLLAKANITDVDVVNINGKLTDCYDPKHKVVKLSNSTYASSSISSLGVCAHEIGHVMQHHSGSLLFRLRLIFVPISNFISKMCIPFVLLGSILSFTFYIPVVGYYIILASVILYGTSVVFYLLTLPLEFNASKRALQMLKENEIMDSTELANTKKVLNAAAQTYVSAFFTSLLYFLRFLSYAMILRRRD